MCRIIVKARNICKFFASSVFKACADLFVDLFQCFDAVRRERRSNHRDVALAVMESRDHELIAPGVAVDLEIGPDPVMVLGDEVSLGEAAKKMSKRMLFAPARLRMSMRRA